MVDIPVRRLVYFLQIRFFATTVTTKTTAVSPASFTVEFLTKTCGLPLHSALSASGSLQLEEKKGMKYVAVLSFLRSRGFSEDHTADLIKKHPSILLNNLDTTVKPKIEFFLQNGIQGTLLSDLIASNPSILKRSLNSQLKPSYDFLKSFLKTDEEIIVALKRSSWLLTLSLRKTLQPNTDLLIREGVPVSNIAKLIICQPRVITQKPDRMVAAIEYVKKLGHKPDSMMFLYAIRVMLSLSDSTWKRKCYVLKSFGWSEEEIKLAFMRQPSYMSCSEENIRGKMNFIVNIMKVKPAVVVSHPKVLMHGLETRIRPRYNVLKILESKKLIKVDKKILWLFKLSEKTFLKEYVTKHLDQIPGLMEIYRGSDSTARQTLLT